MNFFVYGFLLVGGAASAAFTGTWEGEGTHFRRYAKGLSGCAKVRLEMRQTKDRLILQQLATECRDPFGQKTGSGVLPAPVEFRILKGGRLVRVNPPAGANMLEGKITDAEVVLTNGKSGAGRERLELVLLDDGSIILERAGFGPDADFADHTTSAELKRVGPAAPNAPAKTKYVDASGKTTNPFPAPLGKPARPSAAEEEERVMPDAETGSGSGH